MAIGLCVHYPGDVNDQDLISILLVENNLSLYSLARRCAQETCLQCMLLLMPPGVVWPNLFHSSRKGYSCHHSGRVLHAGNLGTLQSSTLHLITVLAFSFNEIRT